MRTQQGFGNGEATNILSLISARARTNPAAVAVLDANASLTYAELENRSDRLAHLLHAEGVRAGDAVALIMEPSTTFVVAALAVMKSGGAYLPVDAEYPQNRIEQIVLNSGANILLTDRRRPPVAPDQTKAIVLDAGTLVSYPSTPFPAELQGSDLAYIIYTSGSTGQPKGVELTHAGLMNLVSWHIGAFTLHHADRCSQLASLGFDAAVWEIWPVLCAGATLLIPDAAIKTDPHRLRDWIVQQQITVAFAPTCIAEMLMTMPWSSDTALRYLLTGADVLQRYPGPELPFQVVNNYGPTECTVVATSGVVPPTRAKDLPGIGQAIDGVQVYILDEAHRPVSAGSPGEICIGGISLARGYRNNSELTAEKFVTVDTPQGPARVYKTGDIGRMAADGEIEFRGRADQQVKIRGYRIELQEIAFALNQHPDVRASAVVAAKNGNGEPELIAYVVAQGSASTSNWSSHLAALLPHYMIPLIFVEIPELPLTTNGKLDYSALPAPPRKAVSADFVAPRSLVEERMERLVSQLLGVNTVSVRDNFFLLGGHSLFGAQLISRVRNSFGIELPLRRVFEQPTIELLSQEVELALLARLRADGGGAGLQAQ